MDVRNDNKLMQILADVSDNANALNIPQLGAITRTMMEHPEWINIEKDATLRVLAEAALNMRRTYTSVHSLRSSYENLLTRYVWLLCVAREVTLRYEFPRGGVLLVGKQLVGIDEGLKNVIEIRNVSPTLGVINHEYVEYPSINMLDTIRWRMRSVSVSKSPWGHPTVESFLKYKQEVANGTFYRDL